MTGTAWAFMLIVWAIIFIAVVAALSKIVGKNSQKLLKNIIIYYILAKRAVYKKL